MIYTAIDNFYLTQEELDNSPSRNDGISKDVETQLRIYACEVIQEGGILLKLPQQVMATGQVLFQRFYTKESMLKYNVKRVAWACCWLATKLEETPRRTKDVLRVFNRIDQKREGKPLEPLNLHGKEYASMFRDLVKIERYLLRTFGFVLHVDHPHKTVLMYLNILQADDKMKQEAWNLCNDSLRTTLCLRYKSDVIACGLILLASRRLQYPLPENPPWYQLFLADKKDVYTVAREVHALYQRPKSQYISVYKQKLDETGEKTDASPSTGVPRTPESERTSSLHNHDEPVVNASADRSSLPSQDEVSERKKSSVVSTDRERERSRSRSKDSYSRGRRRSRSRSKDSHSRVRRRSRSRSKDTYDRRRDRDRYYMEEELRREAEKRHRKRSREIVWDRRDRDKRYERQYR